MLSQPHIITSTVYTVFPKGDMIKEEFSGDFDHFNSFEESLVQKKFEDLNCYLS